MFFCLITGGVAVSKRPWCDEGWFADIAYNLAHRGVMGLTLLDPHGFVFAPLVKGIETYTYWVMPGYIFMQTVWYQVLGLSVFTMRALSLAWAIAALTSWYLIVCYLTQSRAVGLVSVLVLALDQHFVVSGASGRMDMMCAALGLISSAVYLRLRARFHIALFSACSILAVALLTHPNALFGAILLSLIVLWVDRDKIRPFSFLLAAIPFLVAVGVWSLYVLQAPEIFASQMGAQANIPHRFAFDWNIFRQFKNEITARYISGYRLRASSPGVALTGSVVLVYLLSLVGVAFIPRLRARPGARFLLILTMIEFTLLSCLQPNWYYLVYVLPAYAAAVGMASVWLWHRSLIGQWAAVAVIAGVVVLDSGVSGFRILHSDYRNRYLPAVDYLKQHAGPNSLIVGSGELAFDLGFEGRVLDDCRLGFTSKKVPDFIVLEAHYRMFWFSYLAENEPATFRYMIDLLNNDYELVYDQTQSNFKTVGSSDLPYQIYRRSRGALTQAQSRMSGDCFEQKLGKTLAQGPTVSSRLLTVSSLL